MTALIVNVPQSVIDIIHRKYPGLEINDAASEALVEGLGLDRGYGHHYATAAQLKALNYSVPEISQRFGMSAETVKHILANPRLDQPKPLRRAS